MRTKILPCFCLLLAKSSFSQDSAFQLKDFKYRTTGYKTLELSTSFGAGVTDNKGPQTVKGKSFHLFPTSFSYNKIKSTDQKLCTSTFLLTSDYNYYSNTDSSVDNKYHSGNANISWQLNNRFFKQNNWYWQISNILSSSGTLNEQNDIENTSIEISNDLVLGFGKGRIEMVQDAQMALFILNDLRNQGLISNIPDAKTVNRFAQLITVVNNRRILDFRRKRIYELSQIDSFLRESGIAVSTDIRHFTVLNDNWAFGFNPLRSSGSDWFFRIIPMAEIIRAKNVYGLGSSDRGLISDFGVRPQIGFENYKPINLKWQRNMGSAFSWSYRHNTDRSVSTLNGITSERIDSGNIFETSLYCFYEVGYYPNNRTRVNANFTVLASYFPYDKTSAKHEISMHPALHFSTDYFISYRTRISAYFIADYEHTNIKYVGSGQDKMHNLNANFSIGLAHAFL